MPIIYIDVLFAVNFLINYILLRACCVFITLKCNPARIGIGAFLGACYSVMIFFPDFSLLYSTICKFLISMLIVASAYPFYSIKSYIKTLLLFYFISFCFGGCVLGVFYFSDIGTRIGAVYSNGVFYFDLPWSILLISGVLFYFLIKIFDFLSGKYYNSRNLRKQLVISYEHKVAEITALLDTGNSLIDPITLSPVIIVEYKSIKNLFSDEIRASLERINNENLTWIMSEIAHKGVPARLIPFSSLGKENGMLIGFVPDKAEIRDECGIRILEKCVIGIYEKALTKDRSYSALLNPYMK